MNIGECSDISPTLQEDLKLAYLLISEGVVFASEFRLDIWNYLHFHQQHDQTESCLIKWKRLPRNILWLNSIRHIKVPKGYRIYQLCKGVK